MRFNTLHHAFDKQAQRYGLDPLMLMAQAFQESRLDQGARSRSGAVGIMQILPTTAADPNVRIAGVTTSAEKNVEAASKYLRFLADTYLDDPGLTPDNKVFMLLAAYNAGPGNLRRVRRQAQKSGLDPDLWFHNVERAAEQLLGSETVNYVNSVYKYYVAYKLADERQKAMRAGVMERPGQG
jgi:membrane-bound lytic murein transglycosylase MltF